MIDLGDSDVPFLPRGVRVKHCDVRKGWYLLAPERAVKLDQIAVAILGVVDGARSFSGIVTKLAQDFDAPPETISKDACAFLTDLIKRRMVELR
ncbi:MAG: pyrroloquinoline quinone biosynthesis peptide chaperone PqqD [Pseudomonadota bacterium]